MKGFWKSGRALIWLTAMASSLGLMMITGLLLLILVNGLGVFWPRPLHEFTMQDGKIVLGETWEHQKSTGRTTGGSIDRIRVKTGNRDFWGLDFVWLNQAEIVNSGQPDSAYVIERRSYGNFFGFVSELRVGGTATVTGTAQVATVLAREIARGQSLHKQIRKIEKNQIGDINYALERRRLEIKGLFREAKDTTTVSARAQTLRREMTELQSRYQNYEQQLDKLYTEARAREIVLRTATGETKTLQLTEIIRAFQPNRQSWFARLGIYMGRGWEFLSDQPREANMEGGVFPAIFGTVMMVFIMSIIVVPFGVLAGVYMREYAKQGTLVRIIRIAVNNLAGVPSIVFGIFGLGLFVYAIGGGIDKFFFAEALPSPTFGTGGILWASLTLALLTVPVVIVSTEDGLASVPRQLREVSLALGATKFETLARVVIPGASPSILTGLILAMARAAGEVAPLMITGVVKLAPSLPLDGHFPFVHLERKFMHLGFHIYDVGFQSPNVEASLPMVYATTLLLILIVLTLNLAAILLRNRLHIRFSSGRL